MPIFRVQQSKLTPIREKKIDLEKSIQKLTEENLNTIFSLEFVASEFNVQNFWVDTLAFDSEAKAFVIIEYKKDKAFSVIDQGYAYLATMLANKGDFILEYNEKKDKNLKRKDIDWTQSKIIFVAPDFTPHQVHAAGFEDIPIELWEVKFYDNHTIRYDRLKSPQAAGSIKAVAGGKTIKKVSGEIKRYTVQQHLTGKSEKMVDLFQQLREEILALDPSIVENPMKFYIGYRISRNFTEIEMQKNRLKIHIDLPIPKLNDPRKMGRDMRKIGHYGTGATEAFLEDAKDIPYITRLIKQSYEASL